eukprot:s6209_g3.t1
MAPRASTECFRQKVHWNNREAHRTQQATTLQPTKPEAVVRHGTRMEAHAAVAAAVAFDPPKRWARRAKAETKDTAGDQPADEAPPTEEVLHNERQPTREEAPEAKPSGPVEGRHKPQEPCPICMEGFGGADGMPRTCRKCGNNFHQGCLAEWARKEQQIKWEQKPWMLKSQFESGSCPCCRSSKGHDKSRRWKK